MNKTVKGLMVVGLLLLSLPAAAEQRTYAKGDLPFERYAAHQKYFQWCLERGLDLYPVGEQNLNTAFRRWDNPVWTEARDSKGEVILFVSSEFPKVSYLTGWTYIDFLSTEYDAAAFRFELSRRTPHILRRTHSELGFFEAVVSFRPDAHTLAHLRYWANTPVRIHMERRALETPDDILFRPNVDISMTLIGVTGLHREFPRRSDWAGTWLTAGSLGGHLFETRDQRLLIGGVSIGGYGSRDQGGWGLQAYPIAIRPLKKIPIYAAPTYTRVWGNRYDTNLIGLQLLFTPDQE